MARRNKPRSIGAEAILAERIRRERSKRGWSPADLAKQMTAAGCSLTTSAVYKIENREAPRRISVDELIALTQILGTTVEDLLTPIEVLDQERARRLLVDLDDADKDLSAAMVMVYALHEELFMLAADEPELFEYVKGHRDRSKSLTATIKGGRASGGDASIFREGYDAFYQGLVEHAQQSAQQLAELNLKSRQMAAELNLKNRAAERAERSS